MYVHNMHLCNINAQVYKIFKNKSNMICWHLEWGHHRLEWNLYPTKFLIQRLTAKEQNNKIHCGL